MKPAPVTVSVSASVIASRAAVLSFDDLNTVYGYGVPGPHMTLTDHSLSYTEDG